MKNRILNPLFGLQDLRDARRHDKDALSLSTANEDLPLAQTFCFVFGLGPLTLLSGTFPSREVTFLELQLLDSSCLLSSNRSRQIIP
jgi:hypothetical protein